MWTAGPKMMARKRAGLSAVLFLGGLATLLYFTNKKIWAPQRANTPETLAPLPWVQRSIPLTGGFLRR